MLGDERPVGVILAGGAGRRIGGRKAFVELGGRPLLAHVIARVAPQVSRLAINATPDAAFDPFGLPVLPDAEVGRGPLDGILTALDWAKSQGESRVLTVAVDTPFLPADLVARLAAPDAPAACAATHDGPHATTALWSAGLRDDLRRALSDGVRKVGDWTGTIGAKLVQFEDASAFLNVNTPEDRDRAEARL
jgi:molybdopterin-guanine dinucleotide biosynthesis protein A